jgi:anaerobic magnesium-protoporphyrin IX monomethyl ester cyclase
MAKVILISPPYIDLYGKLGKAAGRYFPLGLGYIAAYLRHFGHHDVFMYEPEAQGLTYNDLKGIIKKESPDVIGLTCSTPNFHRALELAMIGRENCKAKIIIGGVHASALPEFIVDNYSDIIDGVVIGEGEITMLQLVDAFQGNKGIDTIKGTVFRRSGETIRNEGRPFIEDLDTIPFPARDLIPQDLFRPNLHNARYRHCLTILTSRGCPFNCSFCASRIVSGKKYRMHSAEYVLEEMQMLKTDYHAQQLLITDDTFTINRERLEKICKGMIEKRLNLKWFCFSQVNVVNKEILALMKKAGCYNIGFGVESSNVEILKQMGKPIKPEKALEAIRTANSIGMKTQAFYIFGSPGETKEQMEDTIRFSRKVGSTLAFFNMLVPFPGTRDFDYFFSSVPLNSIEWKDFVAIGESCVLKNSSLQPAVIEKLTAKANILYYSNPKRILNLLFHIRTFHEFINYAISGLSLLKQVIRWLNKKK